MLLNIPSQEKLVRDFLFTNIFHIYVYVCVDVVYQVMDVCSAHAAATGATDALDVALVCIRNLQVD